jgi:hypothetical protein
MANFFFGALTSRLCEHKILSRTSEIGWNNKHRTTERYCSNRGASKLTSHPTALLFMLLFRSLAIGMYIFGWIFTSNFILAFVMIILFLAFDFWTVKNVSGRLLVGLRWWNEIKEDGSNEWIFESKEVVSD